MVGYRFAEVGRKATLGRRMRYLLDTSVVSELAKKRPHPGIVTWLQGPGAFNLVLPFGAATELYRGAELRRKDSPERAAALDDWIEKLIESDIETPALSLDVAKLYGRIAAVPALKNIWVPDSRMKAPRLGLDLMIAAQSIAHSIPLATLNIRDFRQIHQFYPLPGLFDPARMVWDVEPIGTFDETPVRAA